MIKNSKLLVEFEIEQTKKEKLSYQEALRLFKAMGREVFTLGVLPLKNPYLDIIYIKQWLKEFNETSEEKDLLKTFENLLKLC